MSKYRALFIVIAALSAACLAASFVVEESYAGRAKLIQRVKPYDAEMAALIGEPGEALGTPQEMIVSDQQAFMPSSTGEIAFVNDDYLKEKGIYPLQLKTVRYVAGLARLGFASLFGLFLALLLVPKLLRARNLTISASESSPHDS